MNNHKAVSVFIALLCLSVFISLQTTSVDGFAGKSCGLTTPCECGSNCSGTNELFGNSQAYCDANEIECFNTIDDCRDGHQAFSDWVENIEIRSLNDTVYRVGDVIEINATIAATSTTSKGIFIVYANGSANESVNWTNVYGEISTSGSNFQVKTNYTIPNVIGDHSVRVIDIFSQTNNLTCGRSADADFPTFSDTDDIVFTVIQQPAPEVAFTSPTPANNSEQTTVTVVVNVTHNETHPDTLILSWNGTNETYTYSGTSTSISKQNLKGGNYTFYVWLNDTFGNYNQTETRTVVINTPIDIVINYPPEGFISKNQTHALNVTVTSTQNGQNITDVTYQLNQNANISIFQQRFNLSADLSDPDGILNQSLQSNPNLSQSFVPSELMEVKNISLRLHQVGSPNASFQIWSDSNGYPSTPLFANISIDNSSVSSSGFGWYDLLLNQTTTFQNNTKYWLMILPNSTTDYYSWETSDENTSAQGELLQNTTQDALFRIYDVNRYRTTITIVEGVNNLTVFANNTNISVASSVLSLTKDTTPPTFSEVNESKDPLEAGTSVSIVINASDGSTEVDTVTIEFNGTNYTVPSINSNQFNITITTSYLGLNNYSFYLNDSLGNLNVTGTFNITTTDSSPPQISSLAHSPSTDAGLDPGVLVNITATVTDFGEVDTAIMQYKNETSDWINVTMDNSSDVYFSNFTPSRAGNFTFRVWANDTSGNGNFSANDSINTSLDFSWVATPSSFGALSGIRGEETTVGNMTINNTADSAIGFDLSVNQLFVSFNKTDPFTIEAGEFEVIMINATTPLAEAEYPIGVTVDAQNTTAVPSEQAVNATLVAITSGPYLFMEITQFNATITVDNSMDLVAKITNIGNETANAVQANWSVPSDWSTIPEELNKTLGNLDVGIFSYHNITVIIGEDDSTGTKTITITGSSTNGQSTTKSETVAVTTTSTTTTEVITIGGGGGGGGGSGGGGGGSGIPRDETITGQQQLVTDELFELVRGQSDYFTLDVHNPHSLELFNVTLELEGFLSQHISIEPVVIERIGINETASFTINIVAPSYFEKGEHTLTATIQGVLFKQETKKLENNATSTSYTHLDFLETRTITLLIHEVSKQTALSGYDEAKHIVEQITQEGFPTSKINELLQQVNLAIADKDYEQAVALVEIMKAMKDNAVLAHELIQKVNSSISSGEERGLDMGEAHKLLNLAVAAFNREDYETALVRARNADVAVQLLATGKINLVWLLSTYWYLFLLGLILLVTTGLVIERKTALLVINRKMEDLEKEETALNKLIRETQEEAFAKETMGTDEYHKQMYAYRKRLSEISRTKAKLRDKRATFLQVTGELEHLKAEKEQLEKEVTSLQEQYFAQKNMGKKAYLRKMDEYILRETELEKAYTLLELKLHKDMKKQDVDVHLRSRKKVHTTVQGLDDKKESTLSQQSPPKPKLRQAITQRLHTHRGQWHARRVRWKRQTQHHLQNLQYFVNVQKNKVSRAIQQFYNKEEKYRHLEEKINNIAVDIYYCVDHYDKKRAVHLYKQLQRYYKKLPPHLKKKTFQECRLVHEKLSRP